MKAIRVEQFGGPEAMKYVDADLPDLAEGQVLVKLFATGVNPVDTYLRSGSQGYGPDLPFTPGMDGAGILEATGERVWLSGSVTGTYAEYAICRADRVHPLPDHISFEEGACLWVNYATAYRALVQRGGARKGETVLIHGATGGVGTAAIQWCRALGFTVLGTAGDADGEQYLRDQGVAAVFNHGDSGRGAAILDATGDRGVDVILEMAAHLNLDLDLDLLAPGGRVVIIGSRGDVRISPRKTMGKDVDIRGMSLLRASAEDLSQVFAAMDEHLRAGSLRPQIQKAVPLAHAAEAHRLVMDEPSRGKVILIP